MEALAQGTPFGEGSAAVTWFLLPAPDGGGTIITHGGSSPGLRAFAGYHPEAGRGIVIMSAIGNSSVHRFGLAVLRGEVTI